MSETFQILLPQTILAAVASLVYLGGTFPKISRATWGYVALATLLAATISLSFSAKVAGNGLGNLVIQDAMSVGVQYGCLLIGALFVLMSLSSQSQSESSAEFYALLLTMISGLMIVPCANEMVLLFLALELISVPTYVLLYVGRVNPAAQESATKYFLLSILSAALLLYGLSFLYGLTGTTNLSSMREILSTTYLSDDPQAARPAVSVLGVLGLGLVFAGLGFKLAAVPFHFYAPDVYQGTSSFNAGILSVIPKAAGLIALIRVGTETAVGLEGTGQTAAVLMALMTMTLGNCLALLQTNLRRMLAYSGVAHAGYLLVGMAVGFWDATHAAESLNAGSGMPGGVRACVFYLATYSLATTGLFAVLMSLIRRGREVESIEDLTGLVKSQPLMAICAAVFLFSLAGVPPLPGFWGKLSLFMGALSVRDASDGAISPVFFWLAIIGVLNAAVGAVYYLRVVALMFLHDPLTAHEPQPAQTPWTTAVLTGALVLVMGLLPGPLFQYLSDIPVRVNKTVAVRQAVGPASLADVPTAPGAAVAGR